jgi:(S)-2-hydroxyglutarate dehydrogenase
VESKSIVIIGAGIVGLATGLEILRRNPDVALTVLEKEDDVARHQTSHNSGVIHSGIYYKPGTLKARLCRAGADEMISFCREHSLPLLVTGKIIVATRQAELAKLEELYQRGVANGIPGLRRLSAEGIREIEPHAAGISGIHVPGVAVTDYHQVARKLADLIRERGGQIVLGAAVRTISVRGEGVEIRTDRGDFFASHAVNCAGLQSDYVARMAGGRKAIRIAPFRGEYYEIAPKRETLVRGLIYPVPDPQFPFLGVHFTRRVDGGVEAGPNAVFAFKRNGYRATDVNLRDMADALLFPGFWKMAAKHWRNGAGEYFRSFSKTAFVRALKRLMPEIESSDLRPGGSGVRAQALGADGALLDDFCFGATPHMTHVYNVPSPAATASLAIARELVDRIHGAMSLV